MIEHNLSSKYGHSDLYHYLSLNYKCTEQDILTFLLKYFKLNTDEQCDSDFETEIVGNTNKRRLSEGNHNQHQNKRQRIDESAPTHTQSIPNELSDTSSPYPTHPQSLPSLPNQINDTSSPYPTQTQSIPSLPNQINDAAHLTHYEILHSADKVKLCLLQSRQIVDSCFVGTTQNDTF